MALRTAAEYKAGLRDGRIVFSNGKQVEDVTQHKDLGIAVDHVSLDFELAEDPEHRDLMTWQEPGSDSVYSRYFKTPEGSSDLLNRREMIERSTRLGSGVVLLVKEIGSDALFALDLVARQLDRQFGTEYKTRVAAFHRHCMESDLTMAVAQTDVKGDRSLLPSQQEHPDYFVRIVEERKGGIVVRGAKAHTTCAPYVDELIVLPTRALEKDDSEYSVSFAVPVNTPGLKLIASPLGAADADGFHYPVSSKHRMVDSLTIFDDVFVPAERIFLKREWQYSGVLANAFVEKLTKLITYAETVRGLSLAAAHQCRVTDDGTAVPNVIYANLAKHYFASNYHQAVAWLQDIAGGLVVTGPASADLENPQTRPYIERFFGGKAGTSTELRLRAFNLVRDLTASAFGGYNQLLAIHAEGSLEAQKITILRDYDIDRCKELVRTVIETSGSAT